MDSGRFGKRRFCKNMAADFSAKNYAETSQAENICRKVSYDMWDAWAEVGRRNGIENQS